MDKPTNQMPASDRQQSLPPYEPPGVIRLGEVDAVAGQRTICENGSSASGCFTGAAAQGCDFGAQGGGFG